MALEKWDSSPESCNVYTYALVVGPLRRGVLRPMPLVVGSLWGGV